MRLSFVGPGAKRPTLLTLQESRQPRGIRVIRLDSRQIYQEGSHGASH